MIRNAVIIGLGATLLAACVPVQPRGPNPPPSPEPQAETPTPVIAPEGHPLAPVDVRRLTCATLSGSTDDDKAYATSFLLGYRSALMHSHTIEIKRIEVVEETALADCATKPDALATKIFAAALAKIGPGGQVREAPHVRRREPGLAMPGQMSPDQPPQAHPHEPPIQYTPVQTTPPPAAPAQATPTAEPAPTPAAPPPAPPSQAEPAPAAPTPAAPSEPSPPPKPAPGDSEQKQ
jgi:hypothetical protein